jgi:Abortive infection alpha
MMERAGSERNQAREGPRQQPESIPGTGPGAAPGAAPEADEDGVREVATALARMTAEAWWNTATWALGSALRAGDRVMRGAISLGDAAPVGASRPAASEPTGEGRRESLRDRGAELLRKSADVRFDEEAHPAYENILQNVVPDEARILRLLATKGPQPAVDVRTGLPLASQLVALGLTMIGAEAGCRYPDRVHPYLNNLNRLGLVWFSRETVEDPLRYQVLEAQPEVVEALREAGRLGRTVRRSIHLTPFGDDFCRAALPADTIEFEAVVASHPARRGDRETTDRGETGSVLVDPVPPSPEPPGSGAREG